MTLRRCLSVAASVVVLALSARAVAADNAAPVAERTLTLRDALGIARSNAPTVREARARIAQAEARISQAGVPRRPTLNVVGSANGFVSNGSFVSQGVTVDTGETATWGDGTANLSWTFLDFRTSDAVRAAEHGLDAASADARASEQVAMTQAAVLFYTLLADEDLVAAAQKSVQQRERALATAKALGSAGLRSPTDVFRATVALESAKSDLALAEGAAQEDAVALAGVLLLPVGERLRLVRPPEARVPLDPVGAANAAVANRPELASARARVEQSHAELDAARGARLPTLGLQASGSARYTQITSNGASGSGPSQIGQGGIVLTIPILDPHASANVRAAEAQVAAADAELFRQSMQVRYEAARAAIAARSAVAVLERAKEQAESAAQHLVTIEERYKSGVATPLELLDAQREDAIARTLVVTSRRAVDIASLRVLSAVGKIATLGS
jgi:outer membrane protein TolC